MSQLPYKPMWKAGNYQSSGIREGTILDSNADVGLYGIKTIPIHTQVLNSVYLNPQLDSVTWPFSQTPVSGTSAIPLIVNTVNDANTGVVKYAANMKTLSHNYPTATAASCLDVARALLYVIESNADSTSATITFTITGYDYRYQQIKEVVTVKNDPNTGTYAEGKVCFSYITGGTATGAGLAGTVNVHVTAANTFGLDYYVSDPSLVDVTSTLFQEYNQILTLDGGESSYIVDHIINPAVISATYYGLNLDASTFAPLSSFYDASNFTVSVKGEASQKVSINMNIENPLVIAGQTTNPVVGVYYDARGFVSLYNHNIGYSTLNPRSSLTFTYPVLGAFGPNQTELALFGATPWP